MEHEYVATYTVYCNSSPMGTEDKSFYAETKREARKMAEEYQDRLEGSYYMRDPDNDYWCPLDELERVD